MKTLTQLTAAEIKTSGAQGVTTVCGLTVTHDGGSYIATKLVDGVKREVIETTLAGLKKSAHVDNFDAKSLLADDMEAVENLYINFNGEKAQTIGAELLCTSVDGNKLIKTTQFCPHTLVRYSGADWREVKPVYYDRVNLNEYIELLYAEMVERFKLSIDRVFVAYCIGETFAQVAENEHGNTIDGHFKNRIQKAFRRVTGLDFAKVELENSSFGASLEFTVGNVNESVKLTGWNQALTFNKDNEQLNYWLPVRLGQVVALSTKAELSRRVKTLFKAVGTLAAAYADFQQTSGMQYAVKLEHIIKLPECRDNIHLNNLFK